MANHHRGGIQAVSKILTRFDVEKTLRVPMEWTPVLPIPPKNRMIAVDELGFSWEFWLDSVIPQIGEIEFHDRCIAFLEQKEWRDFVLAKDLRAGHKIVIDTEGGCEFRGIKLRVTAHKFDSDNITTFRS